LTLKNKSKKKDDSKAAKVKNTKPPPQQVHLESLIFKFEPHRRWRDDDWSNHPEAPTQNEPTADGSENVTRGTRKGRGGQGRGTGGRYNTPGGRANDENAGNEGPKETLPKPDEWPDLV